MKVESIEPGAGNTTCSHGTAWGEMCLQCEIEKANTLSIKPGVEYGTFEVPPPGDWVCELFGVTGGYKMVLHPSKGGEPNWFWRKMQYLAFGNRWIKSK